MQQPLQICKPRRICSCCCWCCHQRVIRSLLWNTLVLTGNDCTWLLRLLQRPSGRLRAGLAALACLSRTVRRYRMGCSRAATQWPATCEVTRLLTVVGEEADNFSVVITPGPSSSTCSSCMVMYLQSRINRRTDEVKQCGLHHCRTCC